LVGNVHKNLLHDIRNYVDIMENATKRNPEFNGRNFAPVDFFIPSEYQDSKGESRPCYLLTKKGCDIFVSINGYQLSVKEIPWTAGCDAPRHRRNPPPSRGNSTS